MSRSHRLRAAAGRLGGGLLAVVLSASLAHAAEAPTAASPAPPPTERVILQLSGMG
jgi:hypothetical protein